MTALHETWSYALLGDNDAPDFDSEPEPIDLTLEADALARADWHLRHLRVLARDRERDADVYAAEMTRLQERRDAHLATIDRSIEWHSKPVRDLHRAIRARDEKRKTIKLPNGTLKSTAGRERWEIDGAAFVAWALAGEHEDLIRRPDPEPAKNAIKATLTATDDGRAFAEGGQIVPGVEVTPAEVTYTIELGDDT